MDKFIYKVKLQQIETMTSLEELKEFTIDLSSTLNNKGNKQVYFDPSCILGSSYKGVMEIQAFEADFFAHVAFQSFKNYSGFTSTEQCSLEGEWLKNVPTIKIDEYSMKAFVQPITDYQP